MYVGRDTLEENDQDAAVKELRAHRWAKLPPALFATLFVATTAVDASASPPSSAARQGLSRIFVETMQTWAGFESGKLDADQTTSRLDRAHRSARSVVASLEPRHETTFRLDPADAAALDLGRAVAHLTYVLQTVGQFHQFMGPQTNKIGEATDQLRVAQRLIAEIEKLRTGADRAGTAAAAKATSGDEEFVFVILIDTLRADHVGAYGYARNTTPNLDRLAREGILVERAISQASLTNTSVASLVTGLYPRTHKMLGKADWLAERSLVEEIREHAFATGAFSANPIITKAERFDHGYDHFEELTWCRARVLLGEALRWFETTRANHSKIFTYIHLMDPHDFYFPPSPYLEMFAGERQFRIAAYWLDWMLQNELASKKPDTPECEFDPEIDRWGHPEAVLRCLSSIADGVDVGVYDLQNMIDRYDGEIRYADAEIGDFLEYLRKTGVLERSTIVIVSDHGEAFLEHNRLRHGQELYQTQIHVPLIIWKGDGSLKPKRISERVELIDVLPTLLPLIGVELGREVQGRNFANNPAPEKAQYSMTWNGREIAGARHVEIHSIIDDQLKYIRTTDAKTGELVRELLFDVGEDPDEYRDLSKKPSPALDKLRAGLDSWIKATDAPAPDRVREPLTEAQKERLRALGYIK